MNKLAICINDVLNKYFNYEIRPLTEDAFVAEDRFSYQSLHIDFKISKGSKVVDVGSGENPFPYATHLVDLYKGETTHRFRPLKLDSRPFTTCDIESMPFRDKEFDFVYCSHVLEHVKNPAVACEELMRIGKRGYIETPTRTSDIMLNFIKLKDHHRWHVNLLGNTLIFLEYEARERRDTECPVFFKMLHSRYKNPYKTLVRENIALFVNMLLWEERFSYFVFGKDGRLIATNT